MIDIWDLQKEGFVPVIPTNTVRKRSGDAVMGGGPSSLAQQCAERYPTITQVYGRYLRLADVSAIPMLYPDIAPELLLFPTKFHWKDPSHIDLIVKNVQWCASNVDVRLAIPRLGCGVNTGQLDWAVVKPAIEEHIGDVEYVFCEP